MLCNLQIVQILRLRKTCKCTRTCMNTPRRKRPLPGWQGVWSVPRGGARAVVDIVGPPLGVYPLLPAGGGRGEGGGGGGGGEESQKEGEREGK